MSRWSWCSKDYHTPTNYPAGPWDFAAESGSWDPNTNEMKEHLVARVDRHRKCKCKMQQESIPVGCIPSACQPYMFWWPPLGVSNREWVPPWLQLWVLTPGCSPPSWVLTPGYSPPLSIHPWVLISLLSTHPWVLTSLLSTHPWVLTSPEYSPLGAHLPPEYSPLGAHLPPEYSALGTHLPPEYSPLGAHLPPEYSSLGTHLHPEYSPPRKDLIGYPPPVDRRPWKHILPTTSLTGGKNEKELDVHNQAKSGWGVARGLIILLHVS